MDRVCSRCGCTDFHYNRSRMRMECNSCGTPVPDAQQDRQLMQFDRTYAKAMRHLAAGNWDQTIHLLLPLTSRYPTEKKLYLALLRASTRDFTDLGMEDIDNRLDASAAWDKLVRLHGVTSQMLQYSRRRYEAQRAALARQRTAIVAWIFAAAFCSVLTGILAEAAHCYPALLGTGGLAFCLYQVLCAQPVKVIRQLLKAAPDAMHNPFAQEEA